MAPRFRAFSSQLTALVGALWLVSCTEPAGPHLENGGSFTEVSTGGNHTCAVTQSGEVYCWGRDAESQLGDRRHENSAVPVRIEASDSFVSVSAGRAHSCALNHAGQLYCWGRNDAGQLGNGTTATKAIPTLLPTSLRFASVASGWAHTCALAASGQAYCWGNGSEGQLGTGRFQSELTPAAVAGSVRFTTLSSGARHTCGIALDGSGYCWGENASGQLGNGTIDNSAQPTPVFGGQLYLDIAAGETHSCAVDQTNVAFCWGSSEYGELGNTVTLPGIPAPYREPSQVYNIMRYTTISAGSGFSCGVDLAGLGQCWGRGVEGQLGNGQIMNWATPQFVYDGQLWITPWKFVSIAASGLTHACGLTNANTIYCWGRGEFGQLGNTTTSFAPLATRIRTQ